jgi:hypothetical protein
MRKMSVWLLSAVLALGAGAGAVASLAQQPAADAKAEASATTATYYCRVVKNSAITTLPTTMYAYYWSASTDPSGELAAVTTAMTYVNESSAATDGYAEFSVAGVSISYANLIFKTASDWLGTQTINAPIPAYASTALPTGYKVAYNITYFDSSETTKWAGEWESVATPAFTSSYMRLWMERSGDILTNGNLLTFHYFNTALTIDKEIAPSGWAEIGTNRWIAHYDVPLEAVGLNINWKVYSRGYYGSATTNAATYTSGDNAQLFTVAGSWSSLTYTRGAATSTSGALLAAAMKYVFEGYFTCASSKDNGYGAWATVVSTWIHSSDSTPVWWITGNLTDTTDTCYASVDDYATGTRGTATMSLQQQYDMMNSEYTSANPSGLVFLVAKDDSNSTLFFALGTCLIASLGLALALVYRRKRAQ